MNTDKHGPAEIKRKPTAMRFRRVVGVVVGASVIVAFGIFLYGMLRPEPSWNGKRLSGWLHDLRPYAQQSGANLDQAEEAVRAMGKRAIPLLLRWMNSTDNSAKKAVYQMLPRNMQVRLQPEWAFDRWWGAARAFAVLGTNAESAVPELSRLLGTGKRGQAAAAALAGIGIPAFTSLTNALLQESSANDAAYGLTRFGDGALPTFIYALTNSSQTVRQAAFVGLRSCVYDQYLWKDPDFSRSSLKFTTTGISVATAVHAGREKTLLSQTLDQCLASTNQEVATAARLVKAQLGL